MPSFARTLSRGRRMGGPVKTMVPSDGAVGHGCSLVSQAMRRAMPAPPST